MSVPCRLRTCQGTVPRRVLFRRSPYDFSVRLVYLLAVVLVAGAGLAGCGTRGEPNFAAFAGGWEGHDRGLHISRAGVGKESIYDGCCTFDLAVTFQLSDPHGTTDSGTALATVTSVRVGSDYVAPPPQPHDGQVATIRLRDDVLTEPLTGINYCGRRAKPVCGA